MSLLTWFRNLTTGQTRSVTAEEFFELVSDCAVRELALSTCVNMITRALVRCEYKTLLNGAEHRGDMYYRWNVEANGNDGKDAFLQKIVWKLCRQNECLIIQGPGSQLYVADGYLREKHGMRSDVFSQVCVEDYSFPGAFYQENAIFLQLNMGNIQSMVNQLSGSYEKLLAYAESSYKKSRGTKGTLQVPMAMRGSNTDINDLSDFLSGNAKKFLEGNNGILPVYKGYSYSEIGNKTYANDSTRDIRAMIDDVFDFTAEACCIPAALLHGTATGQKDAFKHFMTFCVCYFADLIQTEVNRKLYGKNAYLAGSRMLIDTTNVRYTDVFDASGSIDKLISSGTFCVNDILTLLGKMPINEPWANQHYITKNYAPAAEALEQLREELKNAE